MTLSDFMAQSLRTRFDWRQRNCLFWLADWVMIRRGADPVADLRGRFTTPQDCMRYLSDHGGLLAVVAARASAAGLILTETPQAGDIGVVQVAGVDEGDPVTGAICVGGLWSVLSPGGLSTFDASPLAAWTV